MRLKIIYVDGVKEAFENASLDMKNRVIIATQEKSMHLIPFENVRKIVVMGKEV